MTEKSIYNKNKPATEKQKKEENMKIRKILNKKISFGVLPYYTIASLAFADCIKNLDYSCIQPASLDLRITDEVYQLKASFLPPTNSLFSLPKDAPIKRKIDIKKEIFLPKNIYLIKLAEKVFLPEDVFALASPKSTAGRTNLEVKLVVNKPFGFNRLPEGFKGNLWLLFRTKSFPIRLKPNDRLIQLRFIFGSETIIKAEMQAQGFNPKKLIFDSSYNSLSSKIKIVDSAEELVMTLEGSFGWTAKKRTKSIVNFSGRNIKEDFFRKVYLKKDSSYYSFLLEQNKFYIFSTKEMIVLPADISAEVIPFDQYSGEFRSHSAGFIDPGFVGKITLEITPFEPLLIQDGQRICKLSFLKLSSTTKKPYSGDYQHQKGPKLAKIFY